ncbi:DUF4192 domain-containing protein [Nocardia transvalensis]|uniref:DUF4192 domain-containing protein n=1 Tax=Nocardia transvalensis TaxID=37333 RepID=UPI0018958D75|nr:DUF4192 domain-containing protein [Nocardia transvalensis]MBF6328429.1 DUF4192 domain-containing protein [Nocardia transvalensis]
MFDSDFTADDPGEILAAVPALLGFYPADSVVLIMLEPASDPEKVRLGTAARRALPIPEGRLTTVAREAARLCAQHDAKGVLVILVDSEPSCPTNKPTVQRRIGEAFSDALEAEGIPLPHVWATPTISAGSPWWSVFDPTFTGVVSDPEASPLMVARVMTGRRVFRSWAEFEKVVEPDHELANLVHRLISAKYVDGSPYSTSAVSDIGLVERRREAVRLLIEQVDALASGTAPTVHGMADNAIALCDKVVRDCMLGLATTGRAGAARDLWALLTQSLPDPYRAEAAALLGYSAYMAGDGPAAGIALKAALRSNRRHEMAAMLDLALRTGFPPSQLRRLAERGHETASQLGLSLQP